MVPNVQLSFGPMLIGVYLNMILYGIFISQALSYYRTYKNDSTWIKYLVLYLFIIETINTGCDMAMMYQPLIVKFGQPEATEFFPTLFAAEPITIVAVSTPIQLFFAWRVRVLTKNGWLAALVSLFALVSFGGGVWTTVKVVQIKLFSRKPELHWSALLWLLSACISDVVITVVLVINLSKRRTGFVATDDVISKIIRMTVQTGMLTAICAVGDVVFFMTLPHTALNFLWDLALSKIYSNCLMSTLNARVGFNNTSNRDSSQQLNVISARANRRQLDNVTESSHTMTRASIYELKNNPNELTNTSGLSSHGDSEYGIKVTKVVETSEDPVPLAI